MNKQIDNRLKKAKTPNADFSAHRKILKEAIMQDYSTHYVEGQKQPKNKGWALKLSGSLAIVTVLAVFAFTTLVPSSLTTQKVLAEAQHSQQSAQEQGRYHYTKTVFTDTFNDEEHSFTSEVWEDTETGDHRMRMTDENGNIVNEIVSVDGKFYATPFDNDSASAQFGVIAIDAEPIDLSDLEGIELSEGPLEIENLPEGFFTDNGVIELSEEEIKSLDLENLKGEAVLVDSGFVEIGAADTFYSSLDSIMRSSTTKDRGELFNTLLEEEGAELVPETTWQNQQVVGVSHSEFDGFTSTMFFDAETYEYVGSEGAGEAGFNFVEVIVDNAYSDQAIDLSTDGLEELN